MHGRLVLILSTTATLRIEIVEDSFCRAIFGGFPRQCLINNAHGALRAAHMRHCLAISKQQPGGQMKRGHDTPSFEHAHVGKLGQVFADGLIQLEVAALVEDHRLHPDEDDAERGMQQAFRQAPAHHPRTISDQCSVCKPRSW